MIIHAIEPTPLKLITSTMSQKALYLDAKTNGKFFVGSADIPKPEFGEIVVKIHSAALNPVDWKIHVHAYGDFMKTFPAILGTDIAGEVVEVGDGVRNVAKGDRMSAFIYYISFFFTDQMNSK